VAAFAGLKLDHPENYVHMVDNKKPEFLAKFPHGKIPAFEGKDGFRLVEGTAIARYSESGIPIRMLHLSHFS
jgi:elongation factor 1-gamma